MTKTCRKVLVTGGAGFIGSHLVRELNKRSHEVWLCDLMHSEKMNFVRCNVSKYRQVEQCLSGKIGNKIIGILREAI